MRLPGSPRQPLLLALVRRDGVAQDEAVTDVIALSELSDEPSWREVMGDNYPDFSPRLRAVLNRLPSESVRIANALLGARVLTLAQLRAQTRADLWRIKDIGSRSIGYIDAALAKFGIGREEATPPVVVRDGAGALEAHAQRLQAWVLERMEACEYERGPVRIALDIERAVLTDVMLILDGREPTNKRRSA